MRAIFTASPLLLFFFIGLAALYNPASAQVADPAPSERPRIIKANTLSLFAGGITVFYEQAFAPSRSFQLAVHSGTVLGLMSPFNTRYRSLAPELRFYLRGAEAPQGSYLGPYLKYQHLHRVFRNSSHTENSRGLGAGMTVGHQWVRRGGFVMDVFCGLGYFPVHSSFDLSVDASRAETRLGFSLGHAF